MLLIDFDVSSFLGWYINFLSFFWDLADIDGVTHLSPNRTSSSGSHSVSHAVINLLKMNLPNMRFS